MLFRSIAFHPAFRSLSKLFLVAILSFPSMAAPQTTQRYVVEDINDPEFEPYHAPAPEHEVQYGFQTNAKSYTATIPITSATLRNLSINIANTGTGLVRSPYILGPHGWDFRSLGAIAQAITSDTYLTKTEKFIRAHEWKGLNVNSVLGASDSPYGESDFASNPLRVLNQYGHAMCSQSSSTLNGLIREIPPVGSMYGRKAKVGAHRPGEAFWDGKWHAYDSTPGTGIVQWIYYDTDNVSIAPTWKYLVSNPTLVTGTAALSGFSLAQYLDGATGETFDENRTFRNWDFNYSLRPGEDFTMYFDMRGRLDHVSARQDNTQAYRTYSDYGSGVFRYRPKLSDTSYQPYIVSQANVKVSSGGLVPVDTSKVSSVIFPFTSTWGFVGANIAATFKTQGKVFIAVNSDPYKLTYPSSPVWRQLSTSTREYGTSSIEGKMIYWLKIEFQGAGSGLTTLDVSSEVQMNPHSMPALEPGTNVLRFTAADMGGSTVKVNYRVDDDSPYYFYEPSTSAFGRHIPIRVGGVLQQGSKLTTNDYRKGRFWNHLLDEEDALVPVKLEIFKVSGSGSGTKVRTLVNRSLPYGYFTFFWDGKSDSGTKQPVGMYSYKLSIGGKIIHGERLYLYQTLWPKPNAGG